jgi:hypothetical protein
MYSCITRRTTREVGSACCLCFGAMRRGLNERTVLIYCTPARTAGRVRKVKNKFAKIGNRKKEKSFEVDGRKVVFCFIDRKRSPVRERIGDLLRRKTERTSLGNWSCVSNIVVTAPVSLGLSPDHLAQAVPSDSGSGVFQNDSEEKGEVDKWSGLAATRTGAEMAIVRGVCEKRGGTTRVYRCWYCRWCGPAEK